MLQFCYSLFSCRWLYSHVGQAAERGQRRKSVIRDTSGVDHRAVTILSTQIWFTERRHCTVFRHLMQLSLLVLRWKSTLMVILPKIKKKKSLSNVGHRGTKAENFAPNGLISVYPPQAKSLPSDQVKTENGRSRGRRRKPWKS